MIHSECVSIYISVARSQLDVANLLHGDSIRYEKQNKSLQSMGCLHKVCLDHSISSNPSCL